MVLFKLLGLPFSLPAAGVKFVFNQLIEMAEQERGGLEAEAEHRAP